MKNWKKMTVTAAAFGAMALFAGCTSASAVSLEEARELVRKQVGSENAVVIEQETDREDGVYELEIILDGVACEFEVDSRTGDVRAVEREDDRPAVVQSQSAQQQSITLEEAKAIAYAHAGVPESDAYDKSYENDDGRYEIDFDFDGYEYEYDISYEGKILKSHRERSDDRRVSAPAETKPAETAPRETKPAEPKPTESKSARISGQEALSIALNHAGVSEAQDRDVEWDDGRWEVSFESGRTEYAYKISADGSILHWENEIDD